MHLFHGSRPMAIHSGPRCGPDVESLRDGERDCRAGCPTYFEEKTEAGGFGHTEEESLRDGILFTGEPPVLRLKNRAASAAALLIRVEDFFEWFCDG
jgi:hypothetical protein